jgi:ribonuclease PH
MIGRSLRAALDLRKLGERTITIDCDVIQADGGTRTAAVTGGYVALALAVNELIKAGAVHRNVWRGPVAAVSVGVVQGEPLLDLCYREDSQAEVDLNVVMNARGRYVEVQGTAEGQPFERAVMDRLLNLAQKGIEELLAAQKEALA